MIKRLEYHKEVFAINDLQNDDLSLLKGSKNTWLQFLVERIESLYIYAKYDDEDGTLLNYIVFAKNVSIPISSSIIILHIANDLFVSELLEYVDDLKVKSGAMEIIIETDKEENFKQYGFLKALSIMKR